MRKVFRCVVPLVTVSLIMSNSLFPVSALGAEIPVTVSKQEVQVSNPISLDKAIETAKASFNIPNNYSQFNTGYGEMNNEQYYSLNWNAPDGAGSFHVQINVSTGEIMSMNVFDRPFQNKRGSWIPGVSREEAQLTATKLVQSLASQYLPELELQPTNDLFQIGRSNSLSYTFQWVRKVNGIPFLGNGVTVEVRADNGQVVGYRLNWTKTSDFPKPENIITADQANKIFRQAPMLELQYYAPYNSQNDTPPENQQASLVYQVSPKYIYSGAIDALTGKPVTAEDLKDTQMKISGYSVVTPASPLPEMKEPSKDEVNAPKNDGSLLTKDEAMDAAKQWVEIPKDYTLMGAYLNSDPFQGNVWSLDWQFGTNPQVPNNTLHLQINAKTGELTGLNRNFPSQVPNPQSSKITREEAQKISTEFLQKVQPQRFSQVESSDPGFGYNNPFEAFSFSQIVNGIRFNRNNMYVTIDPVSKNIISYNLIWSDFDFEKPDNILDLQKAMDLFLKQHPLTLAYTTLYAGPNQTTTKLVYQPSPDQMPFSTLDAHTGEHLDWNGLPQSEWIRSHEFTDIKGNPAESQIIFLGTAGLLGEYDNEFHPNEAITAVSLLKAMLIATRNTPNIPSYKDQEVLDQAVNQGWIDKDEVASPYSPIDRLLLAKIMIRFVNMKESAEVQNIYRVPFADSQAIPDSQMGYVALAWGLGMFPKDTRIFGAFQYTTRAEAAEALVPALKLLSKR